MRASGQTIRIVEAKRSPPWLCEGSGAAFPVERSYSQQAQTDKDQTSRFGNFSYRRRKGWTGRRFRPGFRNRSGNSRRIGWLRFPILRGGGVVRSFGRWRDRKPCRRKEKRPFTRGRHRWWMPLTVCWQNRWRRLCAFGDGRVIPQAACVIQRTGCDAIRTHQRGIQPGNGRTLILICPAIRKGALSQAMTGKPKTGEGCKRSVRIATFGMRARRISSIPGRDGISIFNGSIAR